MKFRIKKHKHVYSEGYYYTVQKKNFLFWATPSYFWANFSSNPNKFETFEEAKSSISEYIERKKNNSIKTQVVEELYYPHL